MAPIVSFDVLISGTHPFVLPPAVTPMLRVVPLFETLDDLEYAETAMRQLFRWDQGPEA